MDTNKPRIPRAPRLRAPLTDSEHIAIYNVVFDIREDMLDLKEHVNDELELMNERIDGKLDNDELLTSLGFKLLNNRFGRWVFGMGAALLIGTVTVREWLGPFWIKLIERFLP